MFQLDNIREFSKDDASDIQTLVMLIEQCLALKVYFNESTLSLGLMHQMLDHVLQQVNIELKSSGFNDTDDSQWDQSGLSLSTI